MIILPAYFFLCNLIELCSKRSCHCHKTISEADWQDAINIEKEVRDSLIGMQGALHIKHGKREETGTTVSFQGSKQVLTVKRSMLLISYSSKKFCL